jgi:hypothetical protein
MTEEQRQRDEGENKSEPQAHKRASCIRTLGKDIS